MAVNENVYGNRDNWIVPTQRTEQGATLTAEVYYYDDVAENDNLKIKVANYNTLATPITTMRSQINGSPQATGDFTINNNWDVVTSDGIDKTICQFGIGSQSGLANQEYWYTYYNDTNVTTLLIADNKDIINVAFGLRCKYRPHVYTNRVYLSPIVPYDNGYAYEQGVIQQIWGKHGTFSVDGSSIYGYLPFSGYADAGLITQIPIKNLKISPVIIAYNSNFEPKTFESISGYLAEKQTYNKLCCIKIKFRYAQSTINNFNGEVLIHPFFVDDFIGLNGLWGGNNEPYEWSDSKMHWFYRNSDLDGFIVAGRPPYYYDNNYNRIPWCDIYFSTTWSHDSAIGGIVYQTPDFKFVLDDNNCFTCDVSSMSDEDITKAIRKQLASFGLFFVDDIADINEPLDSDKTFLGILEDGVAYGKYSNGSKNREQDQWNWDTMEENSYDPSNPPAQDRSSDPVTFNAVDLANGGLKRYVLDDTAMSAFGIDLYRVIDTSNPDELIQNQTLTNFLTNNPLDAVVSVKRFPLPDMSQGGLTNIMLGKVKMQTAAKPFSSTATILTCGSVNIPAKFGNFLDYETQYELILPFCGTISLDPKIVTGKNVEVKYSIDYTTGTCTAWILTVTSDGIETVIDSANGNCTIDIPLSGVQTATLTGEIYNANENLKTAKFNAVVNAVSGIGGFATAIKNRDVAGGVKTVANAVNSIHDIVKYEWNINNTQIPFKMIGASSGCNAFQIELTPRLNVYYPIVDSTYNAADYRHNVGAAVCDTTTIGDYSGYAEITNVDLSGFYATAEEKNMIANALTGGVYL